ncbi:hypothetical protein F2Q68_00035585 [Brassica cretica]|uniref:GATA-type domain-containing protein n=2 Tax=Brassica cretica TaxID=69181 RepID=A0A8S9H8A4_BRACR|nr:hypothetical protein F2Q68_00035585 [Brassica cretica]
MTQGRYCESCGWFHEHTQTCLFVHNGNGCSNTQTAVVDCTLSLGPPSTTTTRLSERDKKKMRRSSTSSRVSSFTDTDKNTSKTSTYSVLPSSNRRISGGGDTLLDRRCTNCDTTSTPLWRNGPRGPKSLCNACGIRFKKEERRTMDTTRMTASSTVAQDQYGHHPSSYSNHNNATDQSGLSTCNFVASEIMLNHDYGGAGEYYRRNPVDGVNGLPSHSWINVEDTAMSLVYDFTRYMAIVVNSFSFFFFSQRFANSVRIKSMADVKDWGLEALEKLKSTEPPVFLAPSSISEVARVASQYIFDKLKPHNLKSPFDELLVDGFDLAAD